MKANTIVLGHKFHNLTVLSQVESGSDGSRRFACLCKCGGRTVVSASVIKRETIKGCRKCGYKTTWDNRRRTLPSGEIRSETTEYTIWKGMKQRCYSPGTKGYKYYGALGVRVCARWMDSFDAFLTDMGRRPAGCTLDRIDPCGNYQPDNCRWATITVQSRNKRNTRCIELDGQRVPLAQIAEDLGIGVRAIYNRLNSGWSPERTASTPAMTRRESGLLRHCVERKGE